MHALRACELVVSYIAYHTSAHVSTTVKTKEPLSKNGCMDRKHLFGAPLRQDIVESKDDCVILEQAHERKQQRTRKRGIEKT